MNAVKVTEDIKVGHLRDSNIHTRSKTQRKRPSYSLMTPAPIDRTG